MTRAAVPRVFRAWLEGSPAAAYLLAGEGPGLSDLLGDLWVARFREEGTSVELARWTVADMERDSASAAWRSPSFFARQRIFLLPDLGEMKKAMRDETADYLRAPDPGVVLIIPCSDRGHARTFSALPGVAALALREDEAVSALAGHAVASARASGAELSLDAATFLVRWVGADAARLKEELGKLLAFAGGRGEVGEEAIRQVCVARGGIDPFALAEALLRNEAGACLRMAREFAASAETGDYHALVGAIAWKARRGLGVRSGGLAPERAGRILSALSRVDRDLKGGSALSPEQLFEINLLKLLA